MTRSTTALAAILALASAPVLAQDEPEKGSPLEGRPETPAAQELAPETPPALPTAEADLPLDMLKAPDGFSVEVYASGIDNARTLRVADDGTVFVGNWQGNDVYVIPAGGGEPRKI